MASSLSVGISVCLMATTAAVGWSAAASEATPPAPTVAPPALTATPCGHLVLQIEGDATSLRVTRITTKADPCGPTDRIRSAHTIVVRAADGLLDEALS